MGASVEAVMRQIHNFFEAGFMTTDYTISGGVLTPHTLLPAGSYAAIEGSLFHGGVWQMGENGRLIGDAAALPDEQFHGRVWLLLPPPAFLALCGEIAAFDEKTPVSALQSESFGEYSYTRAGGRSGGVLTWQEAFAERLSPYRQMFTEVNV